MGGPRPPRDSVVGMGLFGRKKTAVGLDIGSGYLKLVEIDHGGDSPEVVRVAVRPTPIGAVVDGEVVDRGRVADAVRGLMDDAGIKSPEVAAALGGHDVFIKRLEMARMKESEAARTIRSKAERHVPFELDEVRLDFQILRSHDSEPRMEVLLIAAKRERVDDRVALLADAGVKVSLMDVEAFALYNAFIHNYRAAAEGIVAVVNVGHDFTNINILEDGIPVLARDLPFGSRRFRETLQREHGLSIERAEEVVRGRQLLDGLGRSVKEAADGVAVGIERASAFLRAPRSGAGMGRIYLSGGGACLPEMAEALARRIKVETRLVNPFERVAVRPGAGGQKVLAEAASILFLSLGLALRAS